MNEQEKTVEEAARNFIQENYPDYLFPVSLKELFLSGANWQQSDPAFIGEIVRQTLEFYIGYLPSGETEMLIDTEKFLSMQPEIVNQIIKK